MRHKKRPSLDIKIAAVKAVVEEKISPPKVAAWYKVHFTNIYCWVRKFKKTKSFECLKRNHKGGTELKINAKVATKIISFMMKPATEFGFSDGLWTTKRIRLLCNKKFKLSISHVTVWNFLKKHNFSYKKPEKQYEEANIEELQDWLDNTFPEILEKVRKYKGILYFLDESKIQMSSFNGKTWSPKGTRTVIKVSGKRDSINAISAISRSGFLLFNLWDCNIDSDIAICFLKHMLKFHARRHLFVLMDNAPVHISGKIQEFAKTEKRLHIEYLPRYWPKYNPDEFVWNHLKHQELKIYSANKKRDLIKFVSKKLLAMSSNV